jgi:hypothetical protein
MDRREFVQTGVSLCGLCLCSGMGRTTFAQERERKPIEPKKLNYCGYTCPKDCKFLQATLKNDEALKKEAYDLWKIKDRYGVEFDPATAICRGCKAVEEPEGVVLGGCTVRACARKRKLDCCIECADLKSCGKDLWTRFPQFRDKVIEMQRQFVKQGGSLS